MAFRRDHHRSASSATVAYKTPGTTATAPSASTPVQLNKYSLRRTPGAALVRRQSRSASSDRISQRNAFRPVLVALPPNLRPLPSRLFRKGDESMTIETHYTGSKRKRIPSVNENQTAKRRRGSGRGRLDTRVVPVGFSDDEDSDDEISAMDVDPPTRWVTPDDSGSEYEDDSQKTDAYYITKAKPRELSRLRKEELTALHRLAGLQTEEMDPELLTKPELVQTLVDARKGGLFTADSDADESANGSDEEEVDDVVDESEGGASLPPSSPPGDCSSPDEEPTPTRPSLADQLRRRATVNDMGRLAARPLKNRSMSMGNLLSNGGPSGHSQLANGHAGNGSVAGPSRKRTRSTSRSSPGPSNGSTYMLPSPPATRLRHRKLSNETPVTPPMLRTRQSSKSTKKVVFCDTVEVAAPSVDSDLTELEETDEEAAGTTNDVGDPSPRRLRSKGPKSDDGEADEARADEADARRVTPKRKAKARIGILRADGVDMDESVDQDEQDNEQVDQLADTPSPTPTRRRKARPRMVQQTHTPPSDGDDEGDGGEDSEEEIAVEEAVQEVEVTPRKLRNGKIVGADDDQTDEPDEEDDAQSESVGDEDEDESVDAEEGSEDLDRDAEGEIDEDGEDDTSMEEVDLDVATAKTLVRLRRDELVHLCEARELEASGTKPQLAEALLRWRDSHAHDFSSPSSTGTLRPPSTVRAPRRRRSARNSKDAPQEEAPVLLRSHRVHEDEPRTPPLSDSRKDAEPELELDLESLGLEDRELPHDKIVKLEKIGSGGFKDVFIGKFKGRKIAISEFRGQLSAMDIKELKLLGGFEHPNIVRFLGVSIPPESVRDTPVMIVSELCSNGDLFDYIRNVPAPSLHKVLSMMLDIARGLEYLHLRKPSVIHRDCKSSNILITGRGVAKIADFGLAKVKQSTRSMVRSLVGTVNWQAPELWTAHPKYNHKVDVFSCAMVFWEMLQWHQQTKKFPWEGHNEHHIYDVVGHKKQRPPITGLRKQWCPEIVDLMERMWAQEHQDRPTMSEVVQELESLAQRR